MVDGPPDPLAGHEMREPVVLQNHLDRLVVELDELSKGQDFWADQKAAAIDAWEPVFDLFREQLEAEYQRGEHKGTFPSHERLESMCRSASPANRELWRAIKRAEHMLEKRTRRAANVGKQIGGLQSTLKTLGTEAAASGSMR